MAVYGIGRIRINSILDKQIKGLQRINQHSQYNDFGYRLVDGFKYYYIQASEKGLLLNDAIPLVELFIATTLNDTVLSLFLYVPMINLAQIKSGIDKVFGNTKLTASAGEEGITYRMTTLWEKDSIAVFATSEESSEKIKVIIRPINKENIGVGPNVSID